MRVTTDSAAPLPDTVPVTGQHQLVRQSERLDPVENQSVGCGVDASLEAVNGKVDAYADL